MLINFPPEKVGLIREGGIYKKTVYIKKGH